MTDTPTFRLIYRSHNRIPFDQRKAELGSIFSVARSTNAKLGVTGALLTFEDWFVQALEGDEDVVRELYGRISKDARHERVVELESKMVDTRVFARWAMARVADDGEHDIPLLTNAAKGGITPAAPRPTTPEQDVLLDFMRRSITGEAHAI
ncbi:MAG TPA: BLUF domain-containing protein [Pseudonocardia sp.]